MTDDLQNTLNSMPTDASGHDVCQVGQATKPARIWIESGVFGDRSVMVQHEGHAPFPYAVFNYSHRYTSSAATLKEALDAARRLGATDPIEVRPRGTRHHETYEVIARLARLRQELHDMDDARRSPRMSPAC